MKKDNMESNERNEHNALAELAEQLKSGYVSLVIGGKQVATFATHAVVPEIDKAIRIVTELAKVNWPSEGTERAFAKCRSIAEEGSKTEGVRR